MVFPHFPACILVSNTYSVVFFFILYTIYCQFLWTLHYLLPLRYFLTFIMHTVSFQRWNNCVVTSRRFSLCWNVVVCLLIWIWYNIQLISNYVLSTKHVFFFLFFFFQPSSFSMCYHTNTSDIDNVRTLSSNIKIYLNEL